MKRSGAFEHRNPRLFVLFTTLYNARAYYPVLAIFFTESEVVVDLGEIRGSGIPGQEPLEAASHCLEPRLLQRRRL